MAQQDACTLLDEDHVKVERLFQQYKSAHEPSRKRVFAQEICHELTVHTRIEEEIFYPAFAQATGDDQRVEQSRREHQHAKDLVAQVQQRQTDDKLMLDLEEAVLHHVNDERQKMFPEARKAKNLDLMQLADRLEARKAELMASHPA
jgi:hemerythrin superfamily protein